MPQTLKDRILAYQEVSNFKLLPHAPTIICINGRGFFKSTSLLDKPYDTVLAECLSFTMLKLCSEIENVIFGYQYNDEIVLAINNNNFNSDLWYDNNIQKISSVVSSMSTSFFNEKIRFTELNMPQASIFLTNIFQVPTISELINVFAFKQQHNFHTSIQFACFYELLKKYDKNAINDMLQGLSIEEKIDLLRQECDIEYNQYSAFFRRGSACYRGSKIVDGVMKNKWVINTELPIFTKDQSFLNNIFRMGADIFRKDNF